jgi:hypothetical protein
MVTQATLLGKRGGVRMNGFKVERLGLKERVGTEAPLCNWTYRNQTGVHGREMGYAVLLMRVQAHSQVGSFE